MLKYYGAYLLYLVNVLNIKQYHENIMKNKRKKCLKKQSLLSNITLTDIILRPVYGAALFLND